MTLLYFVLPYRFRNAWLLVASCIFYMAFIPAYILILFAMIAIDYVAGIQIEKSVGKRRKLYLIISLVSNVGLLAVFKYYGFFLENLEWVSSFLGVKSNLPALNFVLPIGLSFHTFQAMSYTIEVYRGKEKAERNLIIYSLYVMFYPQLVAGPIERPQNLLHQFREKHDFDYVRVVSGLRLMLWGLLKKMIIADRISIAVNSTYGNLEATHGAASLIAIYFFAIQIYCDFSGYSDIARGAARVMGIELMKNFDFPYFSKSLPEFWRRWHISLSTWFRDYVYLPLGGNKVSKVIWYRNLLIVFLLSGFWHGANWTFVIWGALHGMGIIFYHATEQFRKRVSLSPFASQLITFHFVTLAWVFFRAPNVKDAFRILGSLFEWKGSFTLHHFALLGLGYFELCLAVALVLLLLILENRNFLNRKIVSFTDFPVWARWLSYYAASGGLLLLGKFTGQQFIYFQF